MPSPPPQEYIEAVKKQVASNEIRLKRHENLLEKISKQLDRKLGLPEIILNTSLTTEKVLEVCYDPLKGALAEREEVYLQDKRYKNLKESADNLQNSIFKDCEYLSYWENIINRISSNTDNERFTSELAA